MNMTHLHARDPGGDGAESPGIDLQHRETGGERRQEAQGSIEASYTIIHSRDLV